jgi:hypothetical protein
VLGGCAEKLGGKAGLLTSMWVFEYANQRTSFDIEPGRDDDLLHTLQAANKVLAATAPPVSTLDAVSES